MKKKVLSVLLAGIMAFAMAACGSSGSGSSASSDSSVIPHHLIPLRETV